MQRAKAWITSDEVAHLDHSRAVAHAEERYGTLLCKLSREMVAVEKYHLMIDWLRVNLPRFVELEALRADREIEKEEEQ